MKHIIASAILIVGTTIGVVTHASAQESEVVVKVPFSFVVAGSTLPAGNYRIEPRGDFLLFSNRDRNASAFTTAFQGDPTLDGTSQLKFDVVSGEHFLRKIESPSSKTSMEFPVSKTERNAKELRASRDAIAVTRGR